MTRAVIQKVNVGERYWLCLALLCASLIPSAAVNYCLGPTCEYFVGITGSANPQIQVIQRREGGFAEVWATSTDKAVPPVALLNATQLRPPISNGNYQVEYETNPLTDTTLFLTSRQSDSNGSLSLTLALLYCGKLLLDSDIAAPNNCQRRGAANFVFTYGAVSEPSSLEDVHSFVDFSLSAELVQSLSDAVPEPHLVLNYACDPAEAFYGFGESFTLWNLAGQRVPILVSEQGVGRGLQPITDYYNQQVAPGSGGYWYTTYAPKPLYLSSLNRSFALNTSFTSFFDLTLSSKGSVSLEVWATRTWGRLWASESLSRLLQGVTLFTGRMSPLPEWSQRGAVVGLEGGTHNVTNIVRTMQAAKVPLSGVWLQDWVGMRHSPIDGDRLIWNWELNREYYPGWEDMVREWADSGTRVLTYLNPFFSDPTGFVAPGDLRHNFFAEGIERGYFVKRRSAETGDLEVYLMQSLTITFATLDLTNPGARQWMREIIANYTLGEAQSSGWMCDFGEYLPFDAVLYDGRSGAEFHNLYPQAWAELTREAVSQWESLYGRARDIVYFTRSAWTFSPSAVPVFWLGDQLQSWDRFDGLASALVAALSAGLTGQTITHSDIGGYNAAIAVNGSIDYIRDAELLKRWSEFSAFGFGLFRTHIGSSTSPLVTQVYQYEDLLTHFAEFASIFANLSEFRLSLMTEARDKGLPMVRPMLLHYFYDVNTRDLVSQYLAGEDFLVAPCMSQGVNVTSTYFPALSGPWIHLWSGHIVHTGQQGQWLSVRSGLGFPAVFYREGSPWGESVREFVLQQNYTFGYSWDFPTDDDTVVPDANSNSAWDSLSLVQKVFVVGLPGAVIAAMLLYAIRSFVHGKQATQRKNFVALRVNEEARHSLDRGRLQDDSLMYTSLIPKHSDEVLPQHE